jgi:hypothetical protein
MFILTVSLAESVMQIENLPDEPLCDQPNRAQQPVSSLKKLLAKRSSLTQRVIEITH